MSRTIRKKWGKHNKASTITWGTDWYNMRNKWSIVDCSKYDLRIEQTLTYVQVISNIKQTSIEHEVVIVTRSLGDKMKYKSLIHV